MNSFSRFRALGRASMVVLAVALAACEDPHEPFIGGASPCGVVSPPLLLGAADRVLTDVTLEVQLKGIVMKVVVDDPNGVAGFGGVMQQMEIFQDPACRTQTLQAQNQISTVGEQVSFGTIVRKQYYPELYEQIASSSSWPVRVHFSDNEGHDVEARVRARVVDRID